MSCTPAARAAATIAVARRARVEARDVLGDRAVEQLDVLRQVADVAAERLRASTGRAPRRRAGRCRRRAAPDADERARQRRLAGGARPDDAERRRPPRAEADALHDRALLAGRRRRVRFSTIDVDAGVRQLSTVARLARSAREQLDSRAWLCARRYEAAPVGDRGLDRRQRARHDDRGGDHGAGRQPRPG